MERNDRGELTRALSGAQVGTEKGATHRTSWGRRALVVAHTLPRLTGRRRAPITAQALPLPHGSIGRVVSGLPGLGVRILPEKVER